MFNEISKFKSFFRNQVKVNPSATQSIFFLCPSVRFGDRFYSNLSRGFNNLNFRGWKDLEKIILELSDDIWLNMHTFYCRNILCNTGNMLLRK